ncbi:MAG: murein biosynthesis integral membrane protein MurJ [Candidatus Cloacimonas sp. 4484_275]|nr:MAG: murein biosynthesis integral membrane protein MurJ [Candidatus Cloacimonas sp. 4484_275]
MSKKKLAKNIGSMSVAVFISRIFGLVRDIFMTGFFGTSYVADAFQVSFQIPNLLRKLFGEGALSAAFVPIYNEVGLQKGRKAQIKFALNMLSILSLLLMLLSLLGIIFAPIIVKILAPGFDEKTYLLAIKLTGIMFPYLFFIGLSSTLISILNSHDKFFIPGLSSAFLNISMIAFLGFFVLLKQAASIEEEITVWSVGVVFGGLMQTAVNLPLLKKIGYSFKPSFNFGNENLKIVWKKFLPGVVGLAIRQINLAADLIIASFLVSGSIAALSYGNRLMQLPLGIFGVSAGVAVLPLFSKLTAEEKWNELSEHLKFSIIFLGFLLLPFTALMIGLGKDIIRILFMRGKFDLISLNMSYQALLFYSLGLVFYALNRVLIPIFYAKKDTVTPVKISAFIVVLNIILNIVLMQIMQLAGLALATSISAMVQFFVLKKFLKKKIPHFSFPKVGSDIFKISLLSLLLFLGIFSINRFFVSANFLASVVKVITVFAGSTIFYVIGSQILKIEYSALIKQKLWQKFHKK